MLPPSVVGLAVCVLLLLCVRFCDVVYKLKVGAVKSAVFASIVVMADVVPSVTKTTVRRDRQKKKYPKISVKTFCLFVCLSVNE